MLHELFIAKNYKNLPSESNLVFIFTTLKRNMKILAPRPDDVM